MEATGGSLRDANNVVSSEYIAIIVSSVSRKSAVDYFPVEYLIVGLLGNIYCVLLDI